MKKEPLYAALSDLHDFYGIDLDEDLFETYALSAYNQIGNKEYKIYRYRAVPEKDPESGWFIYKPCNLDEIEAITLDFESAQELTATSNTIGVVNHTIEQWIEADKKLNNELYISGKFVKYKELGDKIYFSAPYPVVNVLYKGQYVDCDGLPYINEKEKRAIMQYCVYALDMKQGRLTKDATTIQLAAQEYQMWQKACSAARAPISISQNAMNEILDAMTSWNKHSYNVSSTKPVV